MQCLNMHQNDFQHLDSQIPDLVNYDLGIKLLYNETQPGIRSEPRLYLYVSVRELKTPQNLHTIHYARSRTYLKDKPPGGQADKDSLRRDVVCRLAADVKAPAGGALKSSEEEPIFVKPVP